MTQFGAINIARRSRRALEHRHRRNCNEANRLTYRSACRNTNRLIKESRRAYYAKKLEDTEGDAQDR